MSTLVAVSDPSGIGSFSRWHKKEPIDFAAAIQAIQKMPIESNDRSDTIAMSLKALAQEKPYDFALAFRFIDLSIRYEQLHLFSTYANACAQQEDVFNALIQYVETNLDASQRSLIEFSYVCVNYYVKAGKLEVALQFAKKDGSQEICHECVKAYITRAKDAINAAKESNLFLNRPSTPKDLSFRQQVQHSLQAALQLLQDFPDEHLSFECAKLYIAINQSADALRLTQNASSLLKLCIFIECMQKEIIELEEINALTSLYEKIFQRHDLISHITINQSADALRLAQSASNPLKLSIFIKCMQEEIIEPNEEEINALTSLYEEIFQRRGLIPPALRKISI